MIKDLLSFLIMPFSFSLILIVFGVIMMFVMGRRRSGFFTASVGILSLYLFGSYMGVVLLTKPLENPYPPILFPEQLPELRSVPPPVIVVMGSGHYTSTEFPAINQLSDNAIHRMNEGLRLHQRLPGSTMILLGGSPHKEVFTSELQITALAELGIHPEDIRILTGALTSEEEAVQVQQLMNQEFEIGTPLILVTTATHMHRSLMLYQAAGLSPVPAASNHYYMGPPKTFWGYFTWNPNRLIASHKAIHEYVGILWSRLRGKI